MHNIARNRSKRLISMVLVGPVVLTVVAVWLMSRPGKLDPRAYSDSDRGSLDSTLDKYSLDLPDCGRAAVRFGSYSQGLISSLYLQFSGNQSGVASFLAANELEADADDTEEGLPFSPSLSQWPQDDRGYVIASSHGGSRSVLVAIDEQATERNVYVQAGFD